MAAFSQRVGAKGPVEVEGTAFGGAESARFSSCNGFSVVGARYGGLGAEVRAHPMSTRRPRVPPDPESESESGKAIDDAEHRPATIADARTADGMVVVLGAASEARRYELLACDNCDSVTSSLPKNSIASGVHLRLGYDWEELGFQIGAMAWGTVGENVIPGDGMNAAPDVCLRFFGGRHPLRFDLGFGSYGASTLLRPGFYLGAAAVPSPGWDISGHLATYLPMGSPKADINARTEIEVRGPLSERVQIGVGAALNGGYHRSDPEAHAVVATVF